MQSVTLARHLTLESVQVQEPTGMDGQGKPTYGSVTTIKARVLRETKMLVRTDGSYVQSALTMWIPADADVIPSEGYRITFESEAFIGVQQKDVKSRNAEFVHRRLRCRRE